MEDNQMPNTSLSDLARRFSEFHNRTVTRAQAMMIEDGAPPEIVLQSQADRRECWRGKKLRPTATMNFAQPEKPQDPGTLKLLADREAAERAKAKAKRDADKEARIIKARQKANPPAAESATSGDETMAKTAKKTTTAKKARKAQPKTGAKRQAKAASKKIATAKARTPIAAGERARYDWAKAAELAEAGKMPPAPDMSAPTHDSYRKRFDNIVLLAKAGDLKGLQKDDTPMKGSTRAAIAKYRDLCIKALKAKV